MRATAACALLLLVACGGPRARPGTPPRHVIVITVESLRADHVSAWLYPRTTTRMEFTPEQRGRGEALSIDELAQQGVMFTRAFAPSGSTGASLASLFTGRPPLEHGWLDARGRLVDSAETLAERFAAAGFDTAAFTANPLLASGSGIEQGFRHFHAATGPDPDVEVVQRAIEWTKTRDVAGGPPLFVWIHFGGPSLPYAPASAGKIDFAALFADPDYAGAADGSRAFLEGAAREGRALSAQDQERVVALYDGEIARVCWLVNLLAQSCAGAFGGPNLLADGVLVFAGAHGEELGERGAFGHASSVHDAALHVPLFVRHPGSLTGARALDEVIELQDLGPTLLDWFGLPPAGAARGRSLLPLVDGDVRAPFASGPAFGGVRDEVLTIRTERWRLVWDRRGAGAAPELVLHDNERDAHERRDASAENPELAAELRAELEAWRAALARAPEAPGEPRAGLDQALEELGYGAAGDPDR